MNNSANRSDPANPFWWHFVATRAAAVVVGFLILWLIAALTRPLALMVLAISVAAALAPLVAWLSRRVPRVAAIAIVYLGLVLIIAAMISALVPPVVNQAQTIVKNGPTIIAEAQRRFAFLNLGNSPLTSTLLSGLGNLPTMLVSLPLSIVSSLLDLLLVIVISLYWLIASPAMREYALSLSPSEHHARLNTLLDQMGRAMGGYIRGVVIDGFAIGATTYIGLAIIGIDYSLLLGLAAGLFELVPIVGPILSTAVVVIAAALQSPAQALIVLVFMLVIMQVENNFLVPTVMGSQTQSSPLLALLALFFGTAAGGFLGALIAIPLVSALVVLFGQVLAPFVRTQTGAPEQPGPDAFGEMAIQPKAHEEIKRGK